MAGPALYDIQALIAAGINPKTGLPIKMGGKVEDGLYDKTRINLRVMDEQQAVGRYTWYNLPDGITSQMLERMVYYKGQLILFYLPQKEQFYFMPYALDGGLDFYGRYTGVHPIPFYASADDPDKENKPDPATLYLSTLKLQPLYDVLTPEELFEEGVDAFSKYCVILRDYTEQLSQNIIPRQQLNEPIVSLESKMLPYMNTALLTSTGVNAIRVNTEDERSNVTALNATLEHAALTGKPYIAAVGTVPFQEINNNTTARGEDYMLAMQSIDNFRLSSMGIDNGSLFEKKAHLLQAELQTSPTRLILQNGLETRQNFCDIVNSLWGLGIWCEASEAASGVDKNLDGELYSEQDQSGAASGAQPEVTTNEGGANNE